MKMQKAYYVCCECGADFFKLVKSLKTCRRTVKCVYCDERVAELREENRR